MLRPLPNAHPSSRHRMSPRTRCAMVVLGMTSGVALGLMLAAAQDAFGAAPLPAETAQGLGLGLVLTLAVVLMA